MSARDAIVTAGLVKRYGSRRVIDGLNLRIPAGVVYGLLGPNGAGKSTLVDLLCGLIAPSQGSVQVAGIDPARDPRALLGVVGYMPQQFSLYGYLSVEENLRLFAGISISGRRAARARVEEVLGLIGLDGERRHRAEDLSGGWRQRLALGCAMLPRPRLLFLDEPTAAVDPLTRRLFWQLLRRLNREGTTVFVTTHLLEEVERCQRLGILVEGRLCADGTPRRLRSAAAAELELFALRSQALDATLQVVEERPFLSDAYLRGDEVIAAFPRGVAGGARLQRALACAGLDAHIEARPPTLEDVFVRAVRRAQAGMSAGSPSR